MHIPFWQCTATFWASKPTFAGEFHHVSQHKIVKSQVFFAENMRGFPEMGVPQ